MGAADAPAAAIPDQRLSVKLSLAAGSGKLDLTDFRLESLPAELFELTELEDLSLAGNCLTHLPEEIGQLTSLKRLQLAGNLLTQLPPSLGKLKSLEGLWLGGNLLTALPSELGQLSSLKQLSVSGNQISDLPPSLGDLAGLVELEAAGNLLEAVPEQLGRLGALRKLSLNGNRIAALPDTLSGLTSLQEMWLMGNRLTQLPPSLCTLPALRQLSVADNALHTLPPLGSLPTLEKLWAYGNALQGPQAVYCLTLEGAPGSTGAQGQWPALDGIWLEGNPLGTEAAGKLLEAAGKLPRLRALGLDLEQLQGVDPSTLRAAGSRLKFGEVLGDGPGYFKLAPSPNLLPATPPPAPAPVAAPAPSGRYGYVPSAAQRRAAQQQPASGAAAGAGGTPQAPSLEEEQAAGDAAVAAVANRRIAQQPVLVVSFGSAPGVPNWGGLLGRLYKSSASRPEDVGFDVLYVVDPARGWYEGGDALGADYYAARLEQYTRRYEHVVMLGDSMGATAALLFCQQATAVLAFCPQVDLSTASIRPGKTGAWLDALRDRVVSAVAGSKADVTALVGTWQHDLDQTKLLPPDRAKVKVFSLDSHRLALYLDQKDKLLPIVRDTVQHQLDVRTGNVRLANFF